jgi:hypothetical protein
MAYEPNLDKCLFSDSCETEWGRLTVSIYSYDNGQKKLQISRENIDTEAGTRFVKLGRLSKKEVISLIPLMEEALNHMD